MRQIRIALAADRAVWPDWLAVLFGCGIALYFALPAEPPLWIALAGMAAALAALPLAWRHDSLRPAVWMALFLALGFGLAVLRAGAVRAPMLQRPTRPLMVEGWVRELDRLEEGRLRVVLDRPAIEGMTPGATPARVRISLRDGGAAAPGNHIRVRAMLLPPSPPEQPGAFDFARQAFFDRLGAVGFSVGKVEILAAAAPEAGWLAAWRLNLLRDRITARIAPPGSGDDSAISAALITGERAGISKAATQAWQDAGLAHLLAISGMNIGLAAGAVFFVARAVLALVPKLALYLPIKNIAAVIAILAAFFYTLLSGSGSPAARSFLMTGLVFTAILIDRRAISMRLVSIAALAILAVWPESLLSASFQMSFAAVAALVAVYEAARPWRQRLKDDLPGPLGYAARLLLDIAATTLVASCATAPFALYHFNRLANYGLLANLVAVPLTTFWITPFQLLVMAGLPFGLEGIALPAMNLGNHWITRLAAWMAGWPDAVTLVPAFPHGALLAMAAGGLWLALWRQNWRWLGIAPVAAGVAWAVLAPRPDILVSGDGKLIALRAPDGQWALSADKPAFTRDQWLRANGQADMRPWPRDAGWLTCDEAACLYHHGDQLVSLVRHPAALEEDCRRAVLVINPAPWGQGCAADAAASLRYHDLYRLGAAAIWLDPAPRLEWVENQRGRRPWTRSVPKSLSRN